MPSLRIILAGCAVVAVLVLGSWAAHARSLTSIEAASADLTVESLPPVPFDAEDASSPQVPVPEPATLTFMAVGATALLAARRRRSRLARGT